MKDTSKMNNQTQQPASESKVENPVVEPNVVAPTPKKSNKNLWIIAGIVIAGLCLCSILCVALLATGVGKVMIEQAPVEATLDTLMKNMEAKEVESAFALFSPRAQHQMSIADLEELTEGNNYKVFEGYESISIQNLNLGAAANTNPDMPQGSVANVTAIVSYTDGFTGDLTAVLEKVDGKWMLFNFHVNVPPDKLQP
jgi:hypothetical protein